MSQPALGQKQITIALAAVIVLLAVLIGVLVWQNSRASLAESAAFVPTDPTAAVTGMPSGSSPGVSQGMPSGMGSQSSAAAFDPATAPVVPSGMTPSEYVTSYYEACAAKEYERAFTLLPVSTQTTYGDATTFANTLEGYGISGFSVDPPVETADTYSVIGWQVAQGMSFGYEWVFVKGDSGEWLLKSRIMAGSQ